MKKIIILILVLSGLHVAMGQNTVEPLKMTAVFNLDGYGNSNMEVSMKLNASQWDMFKQRIGNNVAILKREMERALPMYFLKDFEYSEQSMDRSYTLKFKALGLTKYKTRDRRVLDLDMKNPDVTKVSDDIYMMTLTMQQGGGLLQETAKVIFPPGTSDVKMETDAFGKAIFTYACPTPGAGLSLYAMIAGFLLMGAAGFLFYKNRILPT